jgi:hypothetical protein
MAFEVGAAYPLPAPVKQPLMASVCGLHSCSGQLAGSAPSSLCCRCEAGCSCSTVCTLGPPPTACLAAAPACRCRERSAALLVPGLCSRKRPAKGALGGPILLAVLLHCDKCRATSAAPEVLLCKNNPSSFWECRSS